MFPSLHWSWRNECFLLALIVNPDLDGIAVTNANGEPFGSPFARPAPRGSGGPPNHDAGYNRTLRKNVTPERRTGR